MSGVEYSKAAKETESARLNATEVPGPMAGHRRLPATAMAQAVERFLARSAARPWDPYSSIPWDRLDADRLSEDQRSAVSFITYVEDHLPGYFQLYQEKFPLDGTVPQDEFIHNREFYHFAVKWAQEEDRHANTLFTYQVRAGMASDQELRSQLAEEGRKRFEVPYTDPVQIFTYTLIQEKATQLYYQQLAAQVTEPVLQSILTFLGRDEARHFAFFAWLMEEYIRRYGAALVPAIKDVLRGFKMPLADTLGGYWRLALRVSEAAGGYDHTAAYEELIRVVRAAADAATWSRSMDLVELVRAIRQ